MRHIATALLALCLVLALPSAAGAQTADIAPMDVQVWMGAEPGQLLVIVSTFLPQDTKLPATVKIPVVDGMRVLWAGEIGEQQQGDVQRQPVMKEGNGGQYAEFQVTQSRQAQVELGSVPLSQTAEGFSAKVDFVQTVPMASTSFSVRLPAQIRDVEISPTPTGAPDTNQAGETLYTLPTQELAPGQKQVVTAAYKVGAAPGRAGGGVSQGTVIGVLLGLVALAIVALLLIQMRQRSREAEADYGDAAEDDDSDEY